MAATMFAQSLYGGGGSVSAQETANPTPATAAVSAATPGKPGSGAWGNVPVLPGAAAMAGVSVPVLIAMGAMAWWLFRQY